MILVDFYMNFPWFWLIFRYPNQVGRNETDPSGSSSETLLKIFLEARRLTNFRKLSKFQITWGLLYIHSHQPGLTAVDQLKLWTIFGSGFFLAEKTFIINRSWDTQKQLLLKSDRLWFSDGESWVDEEILLKLCVYVNNMQADLGTWIENPLTVGHIPTGHLTTISVYVQK